MDCVDNYNVESDLTMLKKLTIIIPTFNRDYLERCLYYVSQFPFGAIIVADSSFDEKKNQNRKIINKLISTTSSNILYLQYPPETEEYGGDIYRKWADAVFHVETEYCQICTDKEFPIPITQCKCLKFLEANIEYGVADGIHFNIESGKEEGVYSLRTIPTAAIYESDGWMRFVHMCQNPGCTLLGLHRTSLQKNVYSKLTHYNIDDIRFGEIYLELQDVILGKCMTFEDSVMTYRDTLQSGQNSGYARKTDSSTIRYPQIWKYPSEEYVIKYARFKNGLKESILEVSPDCKDIMEMDSLLTNFIEKRFGKPRLIQKISVFTDLYYKLSLPRWVRDMIQNIFLKDRCGISYISTIIPNENLDYKRICQIISDYQKKNTRL